MTGATDSAAADGSTPEAIMGATYRALCEHGYADLTMQDIADQSDKSKASLHYHYDTKEELLLAFLDHLYDAFTDDVGTTDGDDAVERLVRFVDEVLCPAERTDEADGESDGGETGSDGPDDDGTGEYEEFQTALLEIKAQGPYVEAYREQLERVDAFVRGRVRDIVAAGIDEGTIRSDVDPDDTAAFVATLVDGVNTRRVALGETDGSVRDTFLAYVRANLLAPDADVAADLEPDSETNGGEASDAADASGGAESDDGLATAGGDD
ncbi:TetR family transcriptional regulator [Halosimplex carlsbadense 2-9-1]|uniref:TetR family transcriptional regulator n=1 Tax=Halosimplex carlsbadense 2-9-1 TaxID=797114 RepID=M0CSK8_9EURY|nr:TetR/AcrR family transcriptional regulator [Halosimplex carlsbadense]ELZ25623.1 TetR family transcriptional regulator [Halosimplex carlsbadense 2-9-1]